MRALPLLALLSVVSSNAALAADKVTESRKIGDFQKLAVSGGATLEVKKGPTSLTIEGAADDVARYTTEVVGGELRIRNKSTGLWKNGGPVVIRVTTPSLSRLEASGGVHASVNDVAAAKFGVNLSGGVELNAPKLAVDSMELEASGGVTLNLSGKARDVKLNLSGGVELKGRDLEAAQVMIDASGGCSADLTIKESVLGDISGGVGLKVRGNPPRSRVHTSGGADVDYVD